MDYQQRIDKLNEFKSNIDGISIEDTFHNQSTDVAGWEGGQSREKFVQFVENVKNDSTSLIDYINSFSSELSSYITQIKLEFEIAVSTEVSRLQGIKGEKSEDTKEQRTKALDSISDKSVRDKVAARLGL